MTQTRPSAERRTTGVLRLLADSVKLHPARLERIVFGPKWTLSVILDESDSRHAAGLAMGDASCCRPGSEGTSPGGTLFEPATREPAVGWTERAFSDDPREAAAGLATLNALIALVPQPIVELDAADWLVERSAGRHVAVIGRFPFLDAEVRPAARRLDVYELEPRAGEYGAQEMPRLLPQAEVVAITASTLLSRTLDDILELVDSDARVLLLGPSTPLSPLLFEVGIDLLSGVEVRDVDNVSAAVSAGAGFRRLPGLRRVSLSRTG